MYLAIDIGGTKTLLALFSERGHLEKTARFKTPSHYNELAKEIRAGLDQLGSPVLKGVACGVPGRVDHSSGHVLGYGTLDWPPAALKQDLEKIFDCPVMVENDAKLAGLSEAKMILSKYRRVLYVTIGTGIGTALIMDGQLDKAMINSEGGQIWLERDGQKVQWEDLVSGRAIVERFGHKAQDLIDKTAWDKIAADLAEGLFDLVSVVQPEAVVVGGGVAAHFDKFGRLLNQKLEGLSTDLVPAPPVLKAHDPEEAVVYGAFQLIHSRLG